MTNRALLYVGAFMLTFLSWDVAMGQTSRYQPTSPPLSPYQNYFRARTVQNIPNYYSFVRPEIQARDFVRSQNVINQRQFNRVQSIERRITLGAQPQVVDQQLSLRPTVTGVGQPSRGAFFMEYLQFYSFPQYGR